MSRRRQPDPITWDCLLCGKILYYDQGHISLDDTAELHLCGDCWNELNWWQKLEAKRRWRKDRVAIDMMKDFAAVCRGALDGFHLPSGGLGESQRN